jgi:putative tryptophan/tyrosine transport system substrate-binding protein
MRFIADGRSHCLLSNVATRLCRAFSPPGHCIVVVDDSKQSNSPHCAHNPHDKSGVCSVAARSYSMTWAENQNDRLPELAADLVRRRVAVIAAGTTPSAFAAKAATTTIPVVFIVSEDPVRLGLVTSLARPGGNLTGINFLATELAAKRLELLRQLVPRATRIAVLVNPADATIAETTLRDAETAARAMGLQIQVHNASSGREIEASFASFVRERPDGLFVASAAFFNDRRVQLALLAAVRRVPATYPWRDYAEAGGLMSYGASIRDTFRQLGAQTGRILKGAKPADLPVLQSTKYEFVINLQAAKAIEVEVPNAMQSLADEVID